MDPSMNTPIALVFSREHVVRDKLLELKRLQSPEGTLSTVDGAFRSMRVLSSYVFDYVV